MDMQLNQNHSLFARYMLTTILWTPPLELQPDNLLVSSQGGRDNIAHSFTAGDTLVLSNTMVNAFRVAYNFTDIHRTHEPLGFSAPDVGIKTYSYIDEYMLLAVTNGGFSAGRRHRERGALPDPSINFTDDLTLIKGDHQYGIGASVSWWKSLSQANVRSPGQFTFTGQATGLPLSDFLTGSLNQLIQATPNSLDMQQLYLGLYVQDTWKLSPRATLNYGLRWEPALAQQIRNGAIYNFSADRFTQGIRTTQYANAPPGFLYPGDADFVNGKAGMNNQWLQFSPRVGFAWDPAGDGRMSIRTGYSLAYDFINAQFHLNTSVAPPFNAEARTPTNPVGGFDDPWRGTGNETFFPFTTGPDSPFPLTGPYISISPDLRVPRQQSWNVSFQRQMGDNVAVSATYLGSYSDRMWNVRAINRADLHPGLLHLANAHGPPVLPGLLDGCHQRLPARVDDAGLHQRQVPRRGGRAHHHRGPDVQRAGAEREPPQRERPHRWRQLHAVEVHGAADAGRHHAQRELGLRGSHKPRLRPRPLRFGSPAQLQPDRQRADAPVQNKAARYALSDWRLSGIFRAYSGPVFSVTVNTDPARTGIGGQRANVSGDACTATALCRTTSTGQRSPIPPSAPTATPDGTSSTAPASASWTSRSCGRSGSAAHSGSRREWNRSTRSTGSR